MKLQFVKWLLLGVLAIVPIGCESNTVVDDDPDGATVVEDDDADTTVVTPGGTDTTPPAGSGDTDININTPSTPPASGTDSTQNSGADSGSNANQ
jgi:hypothetical protein